MYKDNFVESTAPETKGKDENSVATCMNDLGGSAPTGIIMLASMRSGEFIPLAEPYGFLACPQSLTTFEGLGHCVGIEPLGVVPRCVGCAVLDLFARCSAQVGPPQGNRLTYKYPLTGYDAPPGSYRPIFGDPIPVPAPPRSGGNQIQIQTIWAGDGGVVGEPTVVHGAAVSSSAFHLLVLRNGSAWEEVESIPLSAAGWDRAETSIAVGNGATNAWTVYGSQFDQYSARSHNEIDWHKDWRRASYEPFAGDGIYRGRMPLDRVSSFEVRSGRAANFKTVTPKGWGGGLLGLRLARVRHSGGTLLVGASRQGLLYTIPTDNASTPLPAFDLDTDRLFYAKLIGAWPVPFPRPDGKGSDDLIIGGENGLYFVRVDPAPSNSSGPLVLRHMGPVLQERATLVTGQTPSVSAADWDLDGMLDLIAGTSEGRILFSRGVKGGFARPVPLEAAPPGAIQRDEILVSGGYRTDIQVRTDHQRSPLSDSPPLIVALLTTHQSRACARAFGGTRRRSRSTGMATACPT